MFRGSRKAPVPSASAQNDLYSKMPAATQGRSLWDTLFFAYFVFQIPSTIFFDSQGVYPEWIYPTFLKWLRRHYLDTYRDPFLADAWKHPWYLSICFVEHYIEIPFYFIAAYAYFIGAQKKRFIILPALIYSIHTITGVLAIFFMAMMQDFSAYHYEVVSPRNTAERIMLCSAYAPFMLFCLLLMVDCIRLLLFCKRD